MERVKRFFHHCFGDNSEAKRYSVDSRVLDNDITVAVNAKQSSSELMHEPIYTITDDEKPLGVITEIKVSRRNGGVSIALHSLLLICERLAKHEENFVIDLGDATFIREDGALSINEVNLPRATVVKVLQELSSVLGKYKK